MVKESYECRWFFNAHSNEQVLPEGVKESFLESGDWAGVRDLELDFPEKWREDTYVCLPLGSTSPTIGIKLRDERNINKPIRLEYKGLVSDFGDVSWGDAVGRVERWSKWSYQNEEVGPHLWSSVTKSEHRVVVAKRRITRKLRLGGRHGIEEVAHDDWVDRGLGIELTIVRANDASFWTLGFEAFPMDSAMPADFSSVVRRFMAGFAFAESCTREASLSYPSWMTRTM